MELCQRVLDGKGMPEDWATSVVIPIFKERRYHELWHLWECKTTRTCNEIF